MEASRKTFVLAAAVFSAISLPTIAADTDKMPATAPSGMTQPQAGAGNMQPMQGGAGVIEANVITTTYTVQNVDPATRMVTLKSADGAIEKVKCGPEVRNFDQIKTGDQVRASVLDEMAVDITPSGGQPKGGAGQVVAVAPKGARPGMMMIQTDQMTAKIAAIDSNRRLVSLEEPSGTTKTIKAGPQVDLTQLKKGDDVTVQVAQGMAITVQAPETSAQPSGATMQPQPMQPQPQQPQPTPQQ